MESKKKKVKKSVEKSDLSVTKPKLNLCKMEDDTNFAKAIETKQIISETKEERRKESKSDKNPLNELEEIGKPTKVCRSDLDKLYDDIKEMLMGEKVMLMKDERMKDDSRKKVVKRKNTWTSGIIQKKVSRGDSLSKIDETEKEKINEGFELSDFVEHDKKYFFVHLVKIGCKLCSFEGKFIVQHYRTSHPESEVLISRVNPDIAKILIDDAIRNREEYEKDHPELEKMASNFKCPFCLMVIKDTTNMYYNHISSHTGEYCFHCDHCSYWTYNHINIHSHLNQMHYRIMKAGYKMVYLNPKILKYVFGYICSKCNFIQLNRTMVEEHAMVYHPGMPEIHRVNLGVLLHDDVNENCMNETLTNKNHSNLNCINTEKSGPDEVHNQNKKIPTEAKELSSFLVQMEELEEVKVKIESDKLDDEPHYIVCLPDLNIKQDSDSETSISDQLQTSLVSTSKDDSKCALVLTDIPMTDTEKQNRKCPKAVAVMMKSPLLNAFYKCPKYDCSFATTLSLSFQKHFTTHYSTLTDTLVPCLYCDYKISCSFYVTHLKVRHGHCLFGCGDCFYRTTNSYFITMHHELVHPNTEFNILQLEVVTSNRISADTTPANLSELVLPYNCREDGFLSCLFKTLYFDEYLKHVEVVHQVDCLSSFSSEPELQKEAVTEGWLVKEVGPFQCRYCKKATVTHQEMGRHQAVFHAQEQCLFYYRKFVPNDTVIIPEQVNLEDPSFINHVIHLPSQVHMCNFKLSDGLLSSTSAKLTSWESEISLPHLLPPSKDTEIESNHSSVSSNKPETGSVLVKDESCLLEESNSLCLDEQPKDGSVQNDVTCKWEDCYHIYHSQMALVKHIEESHVKSQRGEKFTCSWINCPRKSKPYATKHILLTHMRVHSGEKPYKCALQGCNKTFSNLRCQRTHHRSHTRPHFSYNSDRNHHQKTHHDTTSYACQVTGCLEKYSNPDSLQKHVGSHTVDEQLKIKSAENKQKKGDFVPKKSSNSLDKRTYDTCKWKDCYQIYDSQTAFVKHIENNHVLLQSGKKFACFWNNCPRKWSPFLFRRNLSIHMRVHTGEKPCKCPFLGCNKAFSEERLLKIHRKSHTEKPYKCPFQGCNEAFSEPGLLKIHQKSHTGEKPYLCHMTNYSKYSSDNYVGDCHQRVLFGAEAFPCQVTGCLKKYADWRSLRKHMESHTVDEKLELKQKLVEDEQEDDFIIYHL